jgi:hypothetical protein
MIGPFPVLRILLLTKGGAQIVYCTRRRNTRKNQIKSRLVALCPAPLAASRSSTEKIRLPTMHEEDKQDSSSQASSMGTN